MINNKKTSFGKIMNYQKSSKMQDATIVLTAPQLLFPSKSPSPNKNSLPKGTAGNNQRNDSRPLHIFPKLPADCQSRRRQEENIYNIMMMIVIKYIAREWAKK